MGSSLHSRYELAKVIAAGLSTEELLNEAALNIAKWYESSGAEGLFAHDFAKVVPNKYVLDSKSHVPPEYLTESSVEPGKRYALCLRGLFYNPLVHGIDVMEPTQDMSAQGWRNVLSELNSGSASGAEDAFEECVKASYKLTPGTSATLVEKLLLNPSYESSIFKLRLDNGIVVFLSSSNVFFLEE